MTWFTKMQLTAKNTI